MNMIYFDIPDFYGKSELLKDFIKLKFKEPYKFYDDCLIKTVFGIYPNLLWGLNGGGRSLPIIDFNINQVLNDLDFYNSYNISMRFVLTNQLIADELLDDNLCNKFLEFINSYSLNNIRNSCVVASPMLFYYIKEHFKNLDVVWSTTTCITDIDVINSLSKDDNLIIDYNLNNKFDLLNSLNYKNNIEILCIDEGCVDNCPFRHEHYLASSQKVLGIPIRDNSPFYSKLSCQNYTNLHDYYYRNYIKKKYFISLDEIKTSYLNLGFNKFKISGRSNTMSGWINLIENYINYFVKIEYQNDIRNTLLIDCANHNWWKNTLEKKEK